MEFKFNLPIFTDVITARNASRLAIATVPVVYDVSEHNRSELSPLISFDTHTSILRKEQTRIFHEYFGFNSSIFKKYDKPVSNENLSRTSYKVDTEIFSESIFYTEAFRRIADQISLRRSKTSNVWGSNNITPGRVGGCVDGNGFNGYLVDLGDIKTKEINHEQINEQVSGFKKFMRNFIYVDGKIYHAASEPLIELVRNKGGNVRIEACAGSKRGGPDSFIQGLSASPSDREMFLNFSEFKNIYTHLNSLEGGFGRPLFYIDNVDIIDESFMSCDSSALFILNEAIIMVDNFDAYLSSFSGGNPRLIREMSIEQISLYKNLLSAIESSKFDRVTQSLENAIFSIHEYYKKHENDHNFGSSDFLESVIDRVSDVEIVPYFYNEQTF